jgi:hypothetical protein
MQLPFLLVAVSGHQRPHEQVLSPMQSPRKSAQPRTIGALGTRLFGFSRAFRGEYALSPREWRDRLSGRGDPQHQ